MTEFIFDSYDFDTTTSRATFRYKTKDPNEKYVETIDLVPVDSYDEATFERALFLAFMLIGISYYKSFPTSTVRCNGAIDEWQAEFFSKVYQEGLSQFAFENNLTRDDLAQFTATDEHGSEMPLAYAGRGIMTLQSGGKDSLLVAQLLEDAGQDFVSLYVTNSSSYPRILDDIGGQIRLVRRGLDMEAIRRTQEVGGKNGHVPVTYIVLAIGLLQTILDGKQTLLAAIGHEGEEPHAWVGDLPVNHQWSKTWQAEELFAEYVRRYISPDIAVGSILRRYSELKVAELFVRNCWGRFGRTFSSCNRANYRQGADNTVLGWCGDCPKCANSFLLFAPFVPTNELNDVFGGVDLFQKTSLVETFKGLLGVNGVMKPFECIGEVDELRRAYYKALENGYKSLPFDVPDSHFDYERLYEGQKLLAEG